MLACEFEGNVASVKRRRRREVLVAALVILATGILVGVGFLATSPWSRWNSRSPSTPHTGGERPPNSRGERPTAEATFSGREPSSPRRATSAARLRNQPSGSGGRGSAISGKSLWHSPGLCRDGLGTERGISRARYLASFALVTDAPGSTFAERTVPEATLSVLRSILSELPMLTRTVLGVDAPLPRVYVYPSVDVLRANSCINGAAVAYYDGAIHVAFLPNDRLHGELRKSLAHEYAHHVLVSHGVEGPAWFHEGEAMVVAREWWTEYRFESGPLGLETMTEAFPHTASPAFALNFYGQAYTMVTFLARLGTGKGRVVDSAAELVQELAAHRVAPEDLFEWAVVHRLPGLTSPPLSVWENFAENDKQFSPDVQALLDAKSRTSPSMGPDDQRR
jgi:hypothetical protein